MPSQSLKPADLATMSVPSDDSAHVTVELLSQPRYLSGARDLVSSIAKRVGFDDKTCGQMALAVDEALCNVIRHGYEQRSDGRIWIRLWPIPGDNGTPAGLTVVIDDEAKQVDPEKIKGRDLEDVKPGGLGVYIIKQVMDRTEYQRRQGDGMRLILSKLLGGEESQIRD